MKSPRPIPKKRRRPRRVRGRERLYGKVKEARRREIFERSGGRCEAILRHPITEEEPEIGYRRCNVPITWENFHWSHKQHGANKCDCMDCGEALCSCCHLVGIHNPKPCPPKEPMVEFHNIYCSCSRCKERQNAS